MGTPATNTVAYLGALLAMAIGTYLARSLPMAMTSRKTLPAWLVGWLDAVAPAVLGALLAPALFAVNGRLVPPWLNPAFWAALPAALVAIWKRHLALTLVVGVGAYALLVWFMS